MPRGRRIESEEVKEEKKEVKAIPEKYKNLVLRDSFGTFKLVKIFEGRNSKRRSLIKTFNKKKRKDMAEVKRLRESGVKVVY